jgi:thiosulfate/3-mercaptopyruvate sulfurtransferase
MQMVVSTQELTGQLSDPSLVLLHVGSQKDYETAHIPHAQLITLQDISITDNRGLRLQLPDVNVLRAAFGKLGVSETSRVVVYAGTESIQSATRVWFTLDYLGLGDRASLLDGGLALWRAEGRPVTSVRTDVEPTSFSHRLRSEAVVDLDWVRAHKDESGTVLIDARTPEFYSGANPGSMPRAGRIPGARNLPYTSFFNEQGKLKPPDALRQMLGGSGTVVTYCHIGQQATVPYFVARYLGADAKLYDGSFQEWSQRTDVPVATGP